MNNQSNASNQLLDVAQRIREMRQIVGYTVEQMAEKTELPIDIYTQYEAGAMDLPFTFMHKCAKIFGLELSELLEGNNARLSGYAVTRKGKGMVTASEDGITIQDMAAMFRKKLATPYYVTYEYSQELQDKPIHTVTHDGQEFDLVLKGAMRIKVGDHEEVLREGDSIFYKSSTPHGMIAIDGEKCIFLSMIMAGDKTDTAMHHPTAQKTRVQDEPLLCNEFVWGSEDDRGVMTGINFANAVATGENKTLVLDFDLELASGKAMGIDARNGSARYYVFATNSYGANGQFLKKLTLK